MSAPCAAKQRVSKRTVGQLPEEAAGHSAEKEVDADDAGRRRDRLHSPPPRRRRRRRVRHLQAVEARTPAAPSHSMPGGSATPSGSAAGPTK